MEQRNKMETNAIFVRLSIFLDSKLVDQTGINRLCYSDMHNFVYTIFQTTDPLRGKKDASPNKHSNF